MNNSKKYPVNHTIKVPAFNEKSGFYASAKGSYTLSKVKAKNTKIEVTLRKALWKLGYRYRINGTDLPGKPDIVFNKKKVIVFVDGDFWHGYNWEQRKSKLKINTGYWIPKIERNIQRDQEVNNILVTLGWRVLRFWEHQIKKEFDLCIQQIIVELSKGIE